MNNIELNKNESEFYQLYTWISEDNTDQGLMMNKTFSAKILVNANQKKSNVLLTKVIKDNNPLNMDKPDFSKAAVSQEYYDAQSSKDNYVVQNGLYSSVDADGDTYYFRGNVENNYVKIDGLKWKNSWHHWIVGYGGNGKYSAYDTKGNDEKECNNNYSTYGYDSSETCINKIYTMGHSSGEDMLFRIIRVNGDNTIRLITVGPIGMGKYSSKIDSEEYAGYTYHEHTGYKVGSESKISTYRKSLSTNSYYYGDDFTFDEVNGTYSLVNPELHTLSECEANNNLCVGKYTSLSNSINPNKQLYKIEKISTAEPDNDGNARTIVSYYSYKAGGETIFDLNSEIKDSTTKQYIDNWYTTNISKYDNLIATTRYCNDTSKKEKINGWDGSQYYKAADRASNPTLICPNTNPYYGGEYELKAGLLSSDEAIMAGGNRYTNNGSYYLHNGISYWLFSPYNFIGNDISHNTINTSGQYSFSSYTNFVIPVISLRGDTLLSLGDGTIDNPYLVTLN